MRGDLLTPLVVGIFSAIGAYSFFRPIVIEQLRKDGNLDPRVTVRFNDKGEEIIGGGDTGSGEFSDKMNNEDSK